MQHVYAQSSVERFIPVTTLTTNNGLVSNQVNKITQDNRGFIWLGSNQGLSRYDADGLVNYFRDKSNKHSLPDTQIEAIIPMPDNELWLSVLDLGLVVYDQSKEEFTSIKNNSSAKFNIHNNFFSLIKDYKDHVWLAVMGEGLYEWDSHNKQYILHLAADAKSWFNSSKPFDLFIDTRNRLWISTLDSKVFLYDLHNKTHKVFNFSVGTENESPNPIYDFTESSDGNIYAGGYSGVYMFDESTQKFNIFIEQSTIAEQYGNRASVYKLLWDKMDNLWVATTVSVLLFAENKLSRAVFYENGKRVDSEWMARDIYEDTNGGIWFATMAHGVYKLSTDWDMFNIHMSNSREALDIIDVNQFQNHLLISYRPPKIDVLEYKEHKFSLITSYNIDFNNKADQIISIYQDDPNFIWIISITGVSLYDINKNTVVDIKTIEGKALGRVNKKVFRGLNGRLFFSTYGENLFGYIDEQGKTAHFLTGSTQSHLNGTKLIDMQLVGNNTLWLLTNYGIELYDISSNKFEVIYQNRKDEPISGLYIDAKNNDVWSIADGSLHKFNWNGKKLVKANEQYGHLFPRVEFVDLLKVDQDIFWITTVNSGVVELNTSSLEYIVYSKHNGLPSNRILDIFKMQDKKIIATDAGLAALNESYSSTGDIQPRIIIDKISLGDTNILASEIDSLVLSHNYGSLDFDVALLAFTNTSATEYEYILAGINDKWTNTGNDDKYSFLNLSAGDYTFKVRGRSNYGSWSDPVEYSFSVNSPPWKTLWAYFLYTLVILTVLLWVMYLYKRKILYEHEISKQQAKKDLANAASKAKSAFLAKISHEIRTPLNGVLGMSELMLGTNMNEEQRIYANSIMASGSHLLDIINDILDLSKIEAGKLELELQSFDLLLLVDEVIGVLVSQAKQKKLLLTCIFDHRIARNRVGDVVRIKQILFNLLSNAFKFTKQGEIILRVNCSNKDENLVVFTIEDTGIGIDNKLVANLFKPFVQADSAITRQYGGTGLGLAIVKQLVEKMQGSITATGKTNRGSIFTASIFLKIEPASDTASTQNIKICDENICLLVTQQNLKQSLIEYFTILKVKHSTRVKNNTDHLFVDILSNIDAKRMMQIKQAIKINNRIRVTFIGFTLENINTELFIHNLPRRLLAPPITFSAVLKACCKEQRRKNIMLPVLSSPASAALKLLVVEDNHINQQVSIEMLEKMGHIVDMVDSAEEALTMLYRNSYDLLLLDYHLPKMDGLSLIKIWDNSANIPVIVVTADLTDEVLHKCKSLNINNIVAKPFTQKLLFDAINKSFEV